MVLNFEIDDLEKHVELDFAKIRDLAPLHDDKQHCQL